MTPDQVVDFRKRKQEIREQAHANRTAQENKDELSRAICQKFVSLPEYAKAETERIGRMVSCTIHERLRKSHATRG